MINNDIKSNSLALIPFVIFILLFIGSGLITGDFYKMPVLVALFVAILFALMMNRKTDFQTKVMQLSKGGGHPNIILMVIIFLLAGAFASVADGAGAVESTVNLGLTFLPQNLLVVGLFVIGGFYLSFDGNIRGYDRCSCTDWIRNFSTDGY